MFKGINANDSKDLIYFLIEQMNYELNEIKQTIKNKIIFNEDNLLNEEDQSNRYLMLTSFIKKYSYYNNNIIPKLFFSIIENVTICKGCNTHKYNFQTSFSLEFPLENYYNKIYGQQNINNNKRLSLIQCFENYNEKSFFQGDNAIYCNKCKSMQNAEYINRIYSLSPYLKIEVKEIFLNVMLIIQNI